MNNDHEAKMKQAEGQAVQAIGGVLSRRRGEARELRIEGLEGGFVVTTLDPWHNVDRLIVPNADCLASFVQKWAAEGQQGG